MKCSAVRSTLFNQCHFDLFIWHLLRLYPMRVMVMVLDPSLSFCVCRSKMIFYFTMIEGER
jgi:hypothetical protein